MVHDGYINIQFMYFQFLSQREKLIFTLLIIEIYYIHKLYYL